MLLFFAIRHFEMTTQNPITFGVELEFLVPFLGPGEADPAAGTDEQRAVTRISWPALAFSAVQVEIYQLLESHHIPVHSSPVLNSKIGGNEAQVQLPEHWCIDKDQSVAERHKAFGYSWVAVELRSPVLTANTDSFLQVAQVVTWLRERFRIRVNQSTGFHVHIGMGAQPLPPRVVHRLAQLLWCADGMLSGLHPPERNLGFTAPSIRHTSNLALGALENWRDAEQRFKDSSVEHRKPPARDTRRKSLEETSIIRDRLLTAEQFPSLRAIAASTGQPKPEADQPRAPVRDRRDEGDFIYARQTVYRNSAKQAVHMLHNMEQIQQGLFGSWEFPLSRPQGQGRSDNNSTQDKVSWVKDTETLVASTWAEVMNQELVPARQNMSLRAAPEDSSALVISSEQQHGTENGKSSPIPVQAHSDDDRNLADGDVTNFFFHIRQNPYKDQGARSRHLKTNGIEMSSLNEEEWLKHQAIRSPLSLIEGLMQLTNPGLHKDTRRVAHLVSSAGYSRCNYNFRSYGFPITFRPLIMTIEFREATGSMNPTWVAVWARICAGIVEFCHTADQDRFVQVLMRVAEAELNEKMITDGKGEADLIGYDLVSFLADIDLRHEASYVHVMLGKQDRNAFWFPCSLVRTSLIGGPNHQTVEEGRAVLPRETDRY